MKRKRSIYNIAFSTLSTVINICVGLLVPRLFLLRFGSETNGLLNSIAQIVVYLGLLEAGINLAAMQALYKPIAEKRLGEVNGILSAVNHRYKLIGYYYLVAIILLSVSFPMLVHPSSLSYLQVSLVVLLSGLGNVVLFFYQGKYRILLQVEGKSYVLINLQIVATIVTNSIKVFLLKVHADLVLIMFVSFAVSLLQTSYIMYYINSKYSGWIDLRTEPNFGALTQSKYALIHQISGFVFQNTDIILITAFMNLRYVSLYAMYKLVISQLERLLLIPLNSTSFALGQQYQSDRSGFAALIDALEVFYGSVVFAAFSVTYKLLLPFIELYTRGVHDMNYRDPTLALLFVMVAILNLVRYPMLLIIDYAGHYKQTVSRTMMETGINLTASVIGIRYLGIYGVLLGTVLALLYRSIDIIVYSNTKLLSRSPTKTFLIHLALFAVLILNKLLFRVDASTIVSYGDLLYKGTGLAIAETSTFLTIMSIVFPRQLVYILRMFGRKKRKAINSSGMGTNEATQEDSESCNQL